MSSVSNPINLVQLDHSSPPLRLLAEYLCRTQKSSLPDLSQCTVVLPNIRAANSLQAELLKAAEQHGHEGLLLPHITDLTGIAAHQHTSNRLLRQHESILLLLSELRRHPNIYGQGDPWLLAENLLQLFDELTLHNLKLPESFTAFTNLLSEAYNLPADHTVLQREARLVHTLWLAWHTQLQAEGVMDYSTHYILQLSHSLERIKSSTTFFFAGFTTLLPAEYDWVKQLTNKATVHWLHQGKIQNNSLTPELGLLSGLTNNTDYDSFFDACYNKQAGHLQSRITAFKKQPGYSAKHSPIAGKIQTLGVNKLEQHAQAIALFIRAALADGSKQIGIVCEDRQLARRTRALLERSGIFLHDTVGWALSTTRAAAILESWLECIELDFPHQALLDLLKSPALTNQDDEENLNLVYRLEHDIIRHENIGSGLARYKQALRNRAARLEHWPKNTSLAIQARLDSLDTTAARLRPFVSSSGSISDILDALCLSLTELDADAFFANDPAGIKLSALLQQMLQAGQQQSLKISWGEFRAWLRRALEQEYFLPAAPPSPSIMLLNLSQSQLLNFDALVIAAADEKHLPGDPKRLPFFNDSVRSALGLPDWRHRVRQREFIFRQLLSSSSHILLTWQQEREGEPIAATPWLSAIQNFHSQLYSESLEPEAIKQWLQLQSLFPSIDSSDTLSGIPARPTPSIEAKQLPERISVSAHQRLIDCPYRFYVYDILQLKPLDEIREALQKSDYGNRVHRCLEAFHIGIEYLPGPFTSPLTTENREQAIALLKDIANTVFAQDIEDNFQHRGWLQRWLNFIPHYIEWQTKHAQDWSIQTGEQKQEIELGDSISFYGRIDRIDQSDNKKKLIDYKTGFIPAKQEITNGEDIQLSSYSLLMDHVYSVQYIGVDDRKGVNERSQLEGEELKILQQAIKARLQDLMKRIKQGEPLPANGDEATCQYCDAIGICRRRHWA